LLQNRYKFDGHKAEEIVENNKLLWNFDEGGFIMNWPRSSKHAKGIAKEMEEFIRERGGMGAGRLSKSRSFQKKSVFYGHMTRTTKPGNP
jgi:hypothetical protein